jgi:tetratricopeptide (TPR) repeat protein
MTKDNILEKANEIMDEAVEKAGELLMNKPHIAEIILKQLLRCDPEHLAGLQLLGLCKHRIGENAEAVEIIKTALELDPTNADNWNNLGLAYGGMGNYEKSIEAIEKAVELKPEQFLFKNNLSLQYRAIGQYDKSIQIMKEAIEGCARSQLYLNLGGIYGEMKDLDKAEWAFRKALELDPEYPAAHVDMAFVHHLKGRWQEGFKEYEWRFWYYPQLKFYLNAYDNNKLWNGKDSLEGKRIIIYGEQGMGDVIQFSRYCKHLKDRGAYVIVHCAESLESLIKRNEGVDEISTANIFAKGGEELPPYDYQVAMISLPYLLGFPELSGKPYIKPATTAFREYIAQNYGDSFNIGIVWAGSPAHPHDKKRSIPLKHFKRIHDMEGIKLFSLQIDVRKRQYGVTYRTMDSDKWNTEDVCSNKFQAEKGVVDYTEGIEDMKLVDMSPMIQSFDDTATILAGLDLVICCDTAVAHLAGAMGVPVWILIPYNPDWRWKIEGDTTEWYDSMRLFRQPKRDDWDSVFERVEKELHAHLLQNKR